MPAIRELTVLGSQTTCKIVILFSDNDFGNKCDIIFPWAHVFQALEQNGAHSIVTWQVWQAEEKPKEHTQV